LDEIKGVYDLADFVTKKMIFYADPNNFDIEKEDKIFRNTFDYIFENVEDDAFKRFNNTKDRFEGKFLLSAFECIAIGVGKNIERIKGIRDPRMYILKLKAFGKYRFPK